MPLHPIIANIVANKRLDSPDGSWGRSIVRTRETFEAQTSGLGAGPLVPTQEMQAVGREGIIPVRTYFGSKSPRAVIVYAHGGGWSLGSPDSFDTFARVLACRSESTVVLVDYALAPEHPYPKGLHDLIDALHWVADVATGLVEAGTPIVLAGDSAGANLAIAALPMVGDCLTVSRVLLLYPVTDSDFSRPSYREHGEGLLLSGDDMQWFFSNYAPEALWSDPSISVLRANTAEDFPPTFIVTAEYDALRDEGEAFAEKLAKAGVAVSVRRYLGMVHGFARMVNIVDIADQALDDMAHFARTGDHTFPDNTKNTSAGPEQQRGSR